jgi:hypothetical protein
LNTIKDETTKSLVIQKYLEGKSMDKIVDEIRFSKGTVYSIIRDWKNSIGSYDIQEIRNFITSCTKSKITIEQCIQGFRMVNILKDFGIDKNSFDNVDGGDDDFDFNDLYSFIFDVYKNCKKLNISPSIIPLWIKDLMDVYYSSTSNNERFLKDVDSNNDKIHLLFSTENEKAEKKMENNDDAFFHNKTGQYTNNKQSPSQQIMNDSSFLSDNIDIPFTSQVSYFISQKKNECVNLESIKGKLKEHIKKLEEQKHKTMENLDQLYKKEKFILSYINWF